MGHRDWTSGPCDVDADNDLQARIERELPLLLALARRLTRDEQDAQDAVQDALERAWRARHQLRDPAAAGGWLPRTILARNVVDAHRRRADLTTADPHELDMLTPDLDDPAAVVAAAEEELTLRAALRNLVPSDRIALCFTMSRDGRRRSWQSCSMSAPTLPTSASSAPGHG